MPGGPGGRNPLGASLVSGQVTSRLSLRLLEIATACGNCEVNVRKQWWLDRLWRLEIGFFDCSLKKDVSIGHSLPSYVSPSRSAGAAGHILSHLSHLVIQEEPATPIPSSVGSQTILAMGGEGSVLGQL